MKDIFQNIFLYVENKPLLFSQLYFWIFFAVLLLIYSFLYKKNAVRNAFLFFMSLFFYYKSGGYYFSLLIFSTLVDYFIGRAIYRSEKNGLRKFYLILSIISNLGLLSYFKYAYFYTDVINQIFNSNIEVANIFAQWSNSIYGSSFNVSNIILPVGISFFTFQTISYTVDIYRRKVEPVKNIIDFGFYVSFFPQLVAGPIVRASEFVPQLYKDFKLTIQEYGHAIFLILNGLIKKMIISDYISINFVDRVFDSPASYSGFENLMAVYGYSIQIYCDFSGYTDIAIGVALLLGFRLPLNFNSPYKAVSITDFWRRWHISLSSWLRDYLYIPLGGNRKGKIRTYVNLLITMLLGGLWHGASYRFIIWGGLHGLGLAIHKIWTGILKKSNKDFISKNRFSHFLSVFITFNFVTFAWIFFRAENMELANTMMHQIAYSFHGHLIFEFISEYWIIFSLMLIAMTIHWLPVKIKNWYQQIFINLPEYAKIIIIILIVIILYQAKSSEIQPFIYFQF
jgi:alginate O-acetyltransferase complex protein AlgI